MAPEVTLESDAQVVESVLKAAAERYPSRNKRTLFAFDRDNGQFVLLREGWNDFQRNHFAWIHVERTPDGKLWIHRDGTEWGIADELVEAGIPKERIVLAFQHPQRRRNGEFAVS